MTTLHTAADLAAAIADLRPDAVDLGLPITAAWCRTEMHALGLSRYEEVDADTLSTIADRVDTLVTTDEA